MSSEADGSVARRRGGQAGRGAAGPRPGASRQLKPRKAVSSEGASWEGLWREGVPGVDASGEAPSGGGPSGDALSGGGPSRGGPSREGESAGPVGAVPDGAERSRIEVTDPTAMRALAHPVRWALIEALGDAGTLTATQASEILGESPANCAFHLRTLAKYGFVEEAGGGRGRERPWRRVHRGMSWSTLQDDPRAAVAAAALNDLWLGRVLERVKVTLANEHAWPPELKDKLGGSVSRMYVNADEAEAVYAEIRELLLRYADREDPAKRPADAMPIEMAAFAYPLMS
jgi:hypothetical protein